jgi:hypothetical protein
VIMDFDTIFKKVIDGITFTMMPGGGGIMVIKKLDTNKYGISSTDKNLVQGPYRILTLLEVKAFLIDVYPMMEEVTWT